jgi:hypothetical protein
MLSTVTDPAGFSNVSEQLFMSIVHVGQEFVRVMLLDEIRCYRNLKQRNTNANCVKIKILKNVKIQK